VTVLILKVKGAVLPECRPITMAPTIIRLFHCILTKRRSIFYYLMKDRKQSEKGDRIAQIPSGIKSVTMAEASMSRVWGAIYSLLPPRGAVYIYTCSVLVSRPKQSLRSPIFIPKTYVGSLHF